MNGIEWDWTMGVIGDGGSGGIVGIWSKELRRLKESSMFEGVIHQEYGSGMPIDRKHSL